MLVTPDEQLLADIAEILPKLDDSKPTHRKLADICFRLQGILRKKFKDPNELRLGPKRDRAAYMRRYRARQATK